MIVLRCTVVADLVYRKFLSMTGSWQLLGFKRGQLILAARSVAVGCSIVTSVRT